MKNIVLIIVVMGATVFCTGCASLGEFIDYGISEWERIVPADSYDRTYIDAWQSGTGGKALVAGEVAASLLGKSSNKASQSAKKTINDAIKNLNSHDEFKSNDVANWFGAMLTMGDAMLLQHKVNKVDSYLQDPEMALRIESVVRSTGQIKWKSDSQYIQDLMELRRNELESSFKNGVAKMTTSEYFSLPKNKRQEIDMLLLQEPIKQELVKQEQQLITTKQAENEDLNLETPYRDKINSLSVGGYEFNAITLTDTQKDELNELLEYLTADNTFSIEIVGHTCSIGTEKGNYNVGLQRAINARNYLVEKGGDAERIKAVSMGCNCPKASNETPDGRAQNRRITFKVIEK